MNPGLPGVSVSECPDPPCRWASLDITGSWVSEQLVARPSQDLERVLSAARLLAQTSSMMALVLRSPPEPLLWPRSHLKPAVGLPCCRSPILPLKIPPGQIPLVKGRNAQWLLGSRRSETVESAEGLDQSRMSDHPRSLVQICSQAGAMMKKEAQIPAPEFYSSEHTYSVDDSRISKLVWKGSYAVIRPFGLSYDFYLQPPTSCPAVRIIS